MSFNLNWGNIIFVTHVDFCISGHIYMLYIICITNIMAKRYVVVPCRTFIFVKRTFGPLKRHTPAKINVGFKCSIFWEENNGTIYLDVKQILTELLQPKVGTIWCIYAIWLCPRTAYLKKDDVTISFRMMTSSANCLTSKMFT